MTTPMPNLDTLLAETQAILGRLDDVDAMVDRAADDDATMKIISLGVVAQLNPEWMSLAPLLMDRADWTTLGHTLKRIDSLAQGLYRTVLSPRQEEFHNRYKQWLKLWNMRRSKSIQKFLDTADDPQLETLFELLETLESLHVDDEFFHRQVEEWLVDRVDGIHRLDRQAEQLIEELTIIRDTMGAAVQLDQALSRVQVAVGAVSEPILRDLATRWFQKQRHTIKQVGTALERQRLEVLHRELVATWEQLLRLLEGLKLPLQKLQPDELMLAKREAQALFPASNSLTEFSGLLGKVAEQRTLFVAYEKLRDDGSAIVAPALLDLNGLRETLPRLPEPAGAVDLKTYLKQIEDAHQDYRGWSERFDSLAEQLERQRERWLQLIERHGLAATITVQTYEEGAANLDDLISDHNDLVEAIAKVREALQVDLTDEERGLYDRLLDRIGQGEEAIDPIATLEGDADLTPLLGLARRGLINLRVIP